MDNPEGAEQAPAARQNYTPGRPGPVDTLVWHTMDGGEAAARARFQSPTGGASAHYGVRLDGSLVQYVWESDTAWHAGNWPVNQRSVGVEHEDNRDFTHRPPALLERSAVLMAHLLARYPSIPRVRTSAHDGHGVTRHQDVSDAGTSCPDGLDVDGIFARAMQLLAQPAPQEDDPMVITLFTTRPKGRMPDGSDFSDPARPSPTFASYGLAGCKWIENEQELADIKSLAAEAGVRVVQHQGDVADPKAFGPRVNQVTADLLDLSFP